jgi:hypothetical protein
MESVKYKEAYCFELVEHMGKGHSFFSFGGVISVHRDTMMRWTEEHPEFEEARKIGNSKSLLYWETILHDASTKKIRGEAELIVFKLRAQFREDYDDRPPPTDIRISGSGAVYLTIDTGIDRTKQKKLPDVVVPSRVVHNPADDL